MKIFTILFALFLLLNAAYTENFSIEAYNEYLQKATNMDYKTFTGEYPPGKYYGNIQSVPQILYLDSVAQKLNLTPDELRLINKHGFVVTERINFSNFWDALEETWNKDLPLFITTDMVLHAFHKSYDGILMDIEEHYLLAELEDGLKKMQNGLAGLKSKYQNDPRLEQNFNDLDVFITIALRLLDKNPFSVIPVYNENYETIEDIETSIETLNWVTMPLFSESPRHIDFSQFTVRGHYTQRESLGRYFKSMIWLGRTEFYLIPPKSINPPVPAKDVQRQIIDAFLLEELARTTDALAHFENIDKAITPLVGEQDNVKIDNIGELIGEMGYENVSAFLEMENVDKFQEHLAAKPYAEQKILSQILIADPFDTESIQPASAFIFMGQRFIVDSYVLANVVYDKTETKRMLPKTLDILFAMGNNAAGDFLESDLQYYNYYKNLAGLRYLIDSYDESFWNSSFYNGWLNSIRLLNPVEESERGKLPGFMKTAAWWQQKMNTQLAGWAQLRHDNLLYAKQSYTGGVGCSYPYVFVEPEPDFFNAIVNVSDMGLHIFSEIITEPEWISQRAQDYFGNMSSSCSKLGTIAQKELNGNALSSDEIAFMEQTFSTVPNCGGPIPVGWYASMFYNATEDAKAPDYIVADIHTAPTDEFGTPVGWVMHAGTGDINMLFAVAKNNEGQETLFCGPVLSCHEYTSKNFKRLTDEEWKEFYDNPAVTRPEFTQLYLADKNGDNKYENPPILPLMATSVENDIADNNYKVFVHPNPLMPNKTALISMQLPSEIAAYNVRVDIFDIQGKPVINLQNGDMQSGNYVTRWDCSDANGKRVGPGMYLLRLVVNGETITEKIVVE